MRRKGDLMEDEQRYNKAMEYVLRDGEIGCCRNPYTAELEFRMGDGNSVMRDLPRLNDL